MSHNINIQD